MPNPLDLDALERLAAEAKLPLKAHDTPDYAEIIDTSGSKVALTIEPRLVLTLNELPFLLRTIRSYERREAGTQAASDVLAERARQIAAEGWTPEHDDEHDGGELARAGAAYALMADREIHLKRKMTPGWWPWAVAWWKPKDRRSDLVRAGALILAEIERLDRAALAARKEG